MPILRYQKDNESQSAKLLKAGEMRFFNRAVAQFIQKSDDEAALFLSKRIDNERFDVYMVDVQPIRESGYYNFMLAVFDKKKENVELLDGKCTDAGIVTKLSETPTDKELSDEALAELEVIDEARQSTDEGLSEYTSDSSGNSTPRIPVDNVELGAALGRNTLAGLEIIDEARQSTDEGLSEYTSDSSGSSTPRMPVDNVELGAALDRNAFKSRLKFMEYQLEPSSRDVLQKMVNVLQQSEASVYSLGTSKEGSARYVLFDKKNEWTLYDVKKTDKGFVPTRIAWEDLSKKEKKGLTAICEGPADTSAYRSTP